MWTTIVTDVDGVLNTGRFLYDNSNKSYKEFGPHDSDAIKILKKLGINVVAISADRRGFEITKARLNHMGIDLNLVSEKERFEWLDNNYILSEIAFIGDGYFDIKGLKEAVISYAPANAPEVVKRNAKVTLKASGGEGVFLEVLEDVIERFFPHLKEAYENGGILDAIDS